MESTKLLNEEVESITIFYGKKEIAKILPKVNDKGEDITGIENIGICIEYTGADAKTIIDLYLKIDDKGVLIWKTKQKL